MKLNKNCKIFISEINKLSPDNNGIYYTVRYVAETADLPFAYDVYLGVLHTLEDTKVIRWGDKQHTAFALNESGKSYREFDRLEAKERWKERIIGFAVAMLLWGLQFLISKYIG